MKKGVYAGSFDPITNGHLWMIEQGVKLFDHLIVAIGVNPDKTYSFSVEERREMVVASTKGLENISIDVVENQFLVHYASSIGAGYMLRGIRSEADHAFEKNMRHINSDLEPGIGTIFLIPPRNISEVSSSMVRGLIGPQGWEKVVKRFVPEPVFAKIIAHFKGCA
jgi:pantetheine-phosphate adenylyltransferase